MNEFLRICWNENQKTLIYFDLKNRQKIIIEDEERIVCKLWTDSSYH